MWLIAAVIAFIGAGGAMAQEAVWQRVVDQTQQLCCALFQAVGTKLGSKRRLWERATAGALPGLLRNCSIKRQEA
jgi:hypothetical protein